MNMIKIEIAGKWKTVAGVIRALNRAVRKATNYTGEYFDVRWLAAHTNKYGEIFDHDEMGSINVCMNADGVYNYGYCAVPKFN